MKQRFVIAAFLLIFTVAHSAEAAPHNNSSSSSGILESITGTSRSVLQSAERITTETIETTGFAVIAGVKTISKGQGVVANYIQLGSGQASNAFTSGVQAAWGGFKGFFSNLFGGESEETEQPESIVVTPVQPKISSPQNDEPQTDFGNTEPAFVAQDTPVVMAQSSEPSEPIVTNNIVYVTGNSPAIDTYTRPEIDERFLNLQNQLEQKFDIAMGSIDHHTDSIGSFGSSNSSSFDVSSITSLSLSTLTVTGLGTTTFGGGIETTALDVTSTTATSTFANGIDLAGGCFAIGGTCIGGGGGSGTVTSVNMTVPTGFTISGNPVTTAGTLALGVSFPSNTIITANAAGTGLVGTTSQLTVGSILATTTATSQFWGNVGISTSTPWAQFAINPIAGQASNQFVVGSSTATAFVIDGAGRVGVNVLSPTAPFNAHAITTGSAPGVIANFGLAAGSSGSTAISRTSVGWNVYSVDGTDFNIGANNTTNRLTVDTSGAVGIATATPWAMFAVNPTAGIASNQFVVGSSTATNFIVNNSGNAGIGTTSPSRKLSVGNDGTYSAYFTGRVGIGLNNPINSLEVGGFNTTNSNIKTGSLELQPFSINNAWLAENAYFDGSNWRLRANGEAGLFYFYGNEGQFRLSGSGNAGDNISGFDNAKLKIMSDGTFAIGNTLNQAKGDTSGASFLINSSGDANLIGNFNANSYDVGGTDGASCTDNSVDSQNGIVTACGTYSDSRLKSNITDIENVFSKLELLRPVTFNWNSTYGEINPRGMTNVTQYGLIAQDVAAAFPSFVTQQDNGYLSVNYGKFTPLLLEAVSELNLRVESLESLMGSSTMLSSPSFVDTIIGWFVDKVVTVRELVTGTLRVNDKVCADEICISKDQFKNLLLQAGGAASGGSSNAGSGNNSGGSSNGTGGVGTTTNNGGTSTTTDSGGTTPNGNASGTSTPPTDQTPQTSSTSTPPSEPVHTLDPAPNPIPEPAPESTPPSSSETITPSES